MPRIYLVSTFGRIDGQSRARWARECEGGAAMGWEIELTEQTMCGSHKENGHMSPVCWAAVSAVSNYPETQIPQKLVYRGIFASALPQIKGKFHFSCQFRLPPLTQSFMWLTNWGGRPAVME